MRSLGKLGTINMAFWADVTYMDLNNVGPLSLPSQAVKEGKNKETVVSNADVILTVYLVVYTIGAFQLKISMCTHPPTFQTERESSSRGGWRREMALPR